MTAKQTNWTLQVYSMYNSLQDEQWLVNVQIIILSVHTNAVSAQTCQVAHVKCRVVLFW